MPQTQLDPVMRRLRRLAGADAIPDLTDAQLLQRFAARREEAAFAALVRRHGRLVLGVCRRVLHHEQDAEDAFQATFLVLARHAAAIRNGESVGGWLCQVAHRVALKAGKARAKRQLLERKAHDMPPDAPPSDLAWRELQAVLDVELRQLPEKYRAPFVLCCLEGRSKTEAARQLGWKEGTVSGRLAQARKQLQQRLTRRGYTLPAVLCAAVLSSQATASAALVRTTVRAGLRYVADPVTAAVAANVVALAKGVNPVMFLTKTKVATAVFVVVALAAATGQLGRPLFATPDADRPPTAAQAKPPDANPAVEVIRNAKAEEVVVRGRVLGPDGKPRAGVKLYVNPTVEEKEPPVLGTTGDDGRFTLRVPRARRADPKTGEVYAAMNVIATAPGCGPDAAELREGEAGDDLTLRLVKDDVPLQGRILNLEGKPVPGAEVSVRSVLTPASGDLARCLEVVRNGRRPFEAGDMRFVLWARLPDRPTSVTTDSQGRFRLTGIGRERIVELTVKGRDIQHGWLTTMTRAGETVSSPADALNGAKVYGATFTHLVKPSRLITGTVRDKATKKPLVGIQISGQGSSTVTHTDANGRFELQGCPKAEQYMVMAWPRGQPYFSVNTVAADTAGLGPITADLEMEQGIGIRGRVRDLVTGKPVRGYVSYYPVFPNPNVGGGRGRFMGGDWSSAQVGPDGFFTCVVLPGPGALLFRTDQKGYRSACVDPKAFFKTGQDPTNLIYGNKEMIHIAVGGNAMSAVGQEQYQAIALLEPAKGSGPLTQDLTVEPAAPVRGQLLDPEGKPLAGVRARGLREPWAWDSTLKTAEFKVEGVNPLRPRKLHFAHEGRKLVGTVEVKGDEKEAVTVRLQPWGGVTGRLVNADGQPLANMQLYTGNSKKANDPTFGQLPDRFYTDKDGRFRIDGFIPGLKYNLIHASPRLNVNNAGYVFQELTFQAGEAKDLGTVTSKPFRP